MQLDNNVATPQAVQGLTWALVIPTYKREAILPRCLRLAAQQTLPPKEIIVVDASPYWERTRDQILQNLAFQYHTIDWKYVQAEQTSSTAQRNQGIGLATSDILFLIDDDSLMYPNCAEEVIRVYAHDTGHKVVGIMAFERHVPPDIPTKKSSVRQYSSSIVNRIHIIQSNFERFVSQLLHQPFLPYDFFPPKQRLPETIKDMAVSRLPHLHGFAMTFRREIFEQIRFEETLEFYAATEDIDISYRAIRLGILLRALNAHIYHQHAPGGRLSKFTVAALILLNQAVLHCFYSSDIVHFKKVFLKSFWQGLIKVTLKDILAGRLSLPSMRGVLFARRHYEEIFSKTPEELRTWYPKFQRQLISHQKN